MSEFTEHLREVFARFGPISVRRMFGGHGLYRDARVRAYSFGGADCLERFEGRLDWNH